MVFILCRKGGSAKLPNALYERPEKSHQIHALPISVAGQPQLATNCAKAHTRSLQGHCRPPNPTVQLVFGGRFMQHPICSWSIAAVFAALRLTSVTAVAVVIVSWTSVGQAISMDQTVPAKISSGDFVSLWTQRIDKLANRYSVTEGLTAISHPSKSLVHRQISMGRNKLHHARRLRVAATGDKVLVHHQ
jgi:hypothetical protein